jgi:dihydroxy-acid dehydratase
MAEAGPIGLVRDGDRIAIDIPGKKLDLLVDEQEMENRKKHFKWSPDSEKSPFLRRYSRMTSSASGGAVFKY